ncbi:MAG: hypothetical protein WBD10_06790 [Acidobacteriaceae bacterium]
MLLLTHDRSPDSHHPRRTPFGIRASRSIFGKRQVPKTVLVFLILALLPAPGYAAQPVSELPDAPAARRAQVPNPGPPPLHASNPPIPLSKWDGVVDPGKTVQPLTSRDKMLFWLHEEVRPVSFAPAILSAGWGQLTDGDPKYGSDSAAFGERLGAAVLREASGRFFSDSLLPVITREDPRYYRKAYGGIKARGLYAAERVFLAQRDDGTSGFNYSDTLGNLAASALTVTYYPAPSANAGAVLSGWLWSFAGSAGGNLFLEFWPDARDAILHRHPRGARLRP